MLFFRPAICTLLMVILWQNATFVLFVTIRIHSPPPGHIPPLDNSPSPMWVIRRFDASRLATEPIRVLWHRLQPVCGFPAAICPEYS